MRQSGEEKGGCGSGPKIISRDWSTSWASGESGWTIVSVDQKKRRERDANVKGRPGREGRTGSHPDRLRSHDTRMHRGGDSLWLGTV